jgi:hypothetical protein
MRTVPQYQSPYPLLKAWAEEATLPVLRRLLLLPLAFVALILGLAPAFWPLAVLAGAGVCLAAWGLLAHRLARAPSRPLILLQTLTVALGTLCALVGALTVFLLLLGPRWNL